MERDIVPPPTPCQHQPSRKRHEKEKASRNKGLAARMVERAASGMVPTPGIRPCRNAAPLRRPKGGRARRRASAPATQFVDKLSIATARSQLLRQGLQGLGNPRTGHAWRHQAALVRTSFGCVDLIPVHRMRPTSSGKRPEPPADPESLDRAFVRDAKPASSRFEGAKTPR